MQNAIGEKVGNTIHNAATFITGIIIAFIRGWSLTLVRSILFLPPFRTKAQPNLHFLFGCRSCLRWCQRWPSSAFALPR